MRGGKGARACSISTNEQNEKKSPFIFTSNDNDNQQLVKGFLFRLGHPVSIGPLPLLLLPHSSKEETSNDSH